jgi:anti-sigma B factor antagonist
MKFLADKHERYTTFQLLEEKLDSLVSPVLKTELITYAAEGIKNLILDLSQVKYVDSSGLSAILTGNRVYTNEGGIMVIIGVNDHVKKLIKISQLDTVLNILPMKEEAVDAIFLHEIEADLKKEDEE